jgi:hypothetical protein
MKNVNQEIEALLESLPSDFFDSYSPYYGECYEACGLPEWYDENGELISRKGVL